MQGNLVQLLLEGKSGKQGVLPRLGVGPSQVGTVLARWRLHACIPSAATLGAGVLQGWLLPGPLVPISEADRGWAVGPSEWPRSRGSGAFPKRKWVKGALVRPMHREPLEPLGAKGLKMISLGSLASNPLWAELGKVKSSTRLHTHKNRHFWIKIKADLLPG